jgi:hypothetical protein
MLMQHTIPPRETVEDAPHTPQQLSTPTSGAHLTALIHLLESSPEVENRLDAHFVTYTTALHKQGMRQAVVLALMTFVSGILVTLLAVGRWH